MMRRTTRRKGPGAMVSALLAVVGVLGGAALALWLLGERGRLLLPSTRQFAREGGMRRILNGDFLHGYAYARWPDQYIGRAIRQLFPRLRRDEHARRWADEYHGKVLMFDQARAVITLDRDIPLRDLEKIVPYATARDLLLKGPPDIALIECPCRRARTDPCRPLDVCMIVGQPFVDFFLQHNPTRGRRVSQGEALEVLRAEHERGHLHAAYFKNVMLNRFFAICNCCGCCCGGIEAMVKHGVPMLASSGFVAQVEEAFCTRCGTCAASCPFGAIVENGAAMINWEQCMGCGVCEGVCPSGAVSLVRDKRKGEPLDVRLLAESEDAAASAAIPERT